MPFTISHIKNAHNKLKPKPMVMHQLQAGCKPVLLEKGMLMHSQIKGFYSVHESGLSASYFFFLPKLQYTHTHNLSAPCMCAFDKTSHMWTFSTCKSNEWNVCLARICEMRRDGDGCTALPVYSWIKIVGTEAGVCRHTSQTVTLFMHALNLIVTSTTLAPLPLSLCCSAMQAP